MAGIAWIQPSSKRSVHLSAPPTHPGVPFETWHAQELDALRSGAPPDPHRDMWLGVGSGSLTEAALRWSDGTPDYWMRWTRASLSTPECDALRIAETQQVRVGVRALYGLIGSGGPPSGMGLSLDDVRRAIRDAIVGGDSTTQEAIAEREPLHTTPRTLSTVAQPAGGWASLIRQVEQEIASG